MPSTPAEIFSEINSRIAADPAKTAGMNAVYAFELNGESPGSTTSRSRTAPPTSVRERRKIPTSPSP